MTAKPTLLATPAPFIDESPTSWILRICAQHACKVSWIRKHFGLPPKCDFDLDLDDEDWSRVLQETGFTSDWLITIDYMRALRSVELWDGYCASNRRKTYRWCPTCFFFDKIPYFRRSWRFGTLLCATHGCLLKSRCPACGKWPDPNQTSRRLILNLAHCQHCGNGLAANPDAGESRAGSQDFLARYLDGMRAEFCQRMRAIKGEEPFAHEYPHDWRILPRRRRKPLSLDLTAIQFAKPTWNLLSGKKWSDGFERGLPTRMRLAAALALVRRELRAMKSLGEASHSQQDAFADESPT